MYGLPDEHYDRVGSVPYLRELMGDLRSTVLAALR
jgi:hypothetical protein